MEYTFKELKKRQAHADLSILNRDITVCIDRITILVSSDNKYIKPIFREFYHQIFAKLDHLFVSSIDTKNQFTISKTLEEDSYINLIFIEYVNIGNHDDIRIDFNPNTLKEFEGMSVWRQIMAYIKLNRLDIRLSRIDIAFDIYNRPEIATLTTTKGGIKQTIYLGRGGELETLYLGASGSNVQVRLYDKNKESISHKRYDKMDLEKSPFWWRLEFQLRTKAINEETVLELMKRLDTMGYYDIRQFSLDDRIFITLFLYAPHQLKMVYSDMSDNAIAIRKSKLRAKLREQTNKFSLELKQVLEDNLSNLGKELNKYSDEFLGFTI